MCKMCRFAGVPTPKSVSEFIRDSPGHWDTGTGRHVWGKINVGTLM